MRVPLSGTAEAAGLLRRPPRRARRPARTARVHVLGRPPAPGPAARADTRPGQQRTQGRPPLARRGAGRVLRAAARPGWPQRPAHRRLPPRGGGAGPGRPGSARSGAQMGRAQYQEAWAWVHLMLRGTPAGRQVLLTYLQQLRGPPTRPGRSCPACGPFTRNRMRPSCITSRRSACRPRACGRLWPTAEIPRVPSRHSWRTSSSARPARWRPSRRRNCAALRRAGHAVKVVATDSALYFFDPVALDPTRVLRNPDVVDPRRGRVARPRARAGLRAGRHRPPHRTAPVGRPVLVAPLDANTLAKFANGLCDNCLTCVWRAWDPARPAAWPRR